MATSNPVAQYKKALVGVLPGILDRVGMNVYNNHPLWAKIGKTGQKKPWEGEAIRAKIVGATYDKADSYSGYDTLDTTAKEPFTVGDFEMGGYFNTVTIDGMTMAKYRTAPKRLFSLLEDEVKLALIDMRDKMTSHLFAAANDSKGLLSLSTLTDASTTIAGISAGANWGGTTTASGVFASQGKNDMMTMWDTLGQYASSLDDDNGDDAPDLLVTTQAVRRKYWASLEPSMRYTPGGAGDVNLKLSFMGAPIVADTACASGVMYFLNTRHLWLYVVPGRDFTPQESINAIDQDAMCQKILWNGQIVTNARRFNGKLTSIS